MSEIQLALPLEPRPWIWRYCKMNPDADHRSDRRGRAGMAYDCCCPHGRCLTGFAPAWTPGPGPVKDGVKTPQDDRTNGARAGRS